MSNPLSIVQDDPTYSLAASREQVTKLSELIEDAIRYRKALRSLGYDVFPDGGEIDNDDAEAIRMWLSSATRRSLEAVR